MSCPASNLGKALNLAEDGVGGGGPGEGARVKVVVMDEGVDALDELFDGGEGAAANGLLSDAAKPAFDLIEPVGGGGSEVDVVARAMGEPGAYLWVLVGGVVVDDEVQFEGSRHAAIEMAQEGQELLMAMARFCIG